MPRADEFWKIAKQVAGERGGLVVAFVHDAAQPELGSTLDKVLGFAAPGPVTVFSQSDSTDWNEQAEAFYRLRPAWGKGKAADPEAKYYRVSLPAVQVMRAYEARIATMPTFGSEFSLPSLSGYAEPTGKLKGVTFWPRVLARMIDFVVHLIAGYTAAAVFGLLMVIASGGHLPPRILAKLSHESVPLFLAGTAGLFIYCVICDAVHGSTLGKLILSMQVVQEDGSRCRPKAAIIRELGYFVDALFFGLIAYSAMKDTDEQQRHGDEWAHTLVCKRADIPPESKPAATQFALALMLGMFADLGLIMLGLLIQINS